MGGVPRTPHAGRERGWDRHFERAGGLRGPQHRQALGARAFRQSFRQALLGEQGRALSPRFLPPLPYPGDVCARGVDDPRRVGLFCRPNLSRSFPFLECAVDLVKLTLVELAQSAVMATANRDDCRVELVPVDLHGESEANSSLLGARKDSGLRRLPRARTSASGISCGDEGS